MIINKGSDYMNIIEVNNLSKEYKYKVKDNNKGFLYNLFNRWSNVSQGLHGMFLSNSLYHGEHL